MTIHQRHIDCETRPFDLRVIKLAFLGCAAFWAAFIWWLAS